MSTTMSIDTTCAINVEMNSVSPVPTLTERLCSVSLYETPAEFTSNETPQTPLKPDLDISSLSNPDVESSLFVKAMDEYVPTEEVTIRKLEDEFVDCEFCDSSSRCNSPKPIVSSKDMNWVDIPTELNITDSEGNIDQDLESAIRLSLGSSKEEEKKDEEPDTIDIIDEVLGKFNIVNCDWGYNPDKIVDVYMSRDKRRQMRKPLTEKNDEFCLWRAMNTLLETALDLETRMPEDAPMKFYIFDPYNKRTGGTMDEFSKRSNDRELGIKTKLNKEAANVILTIYYVFYMKFKQTTDEIIFEDLYRECVLAQDSNFDLAKFNHRITTGENLKYFTGLRSLMQACLDLTPVPEELREIQFNAWTICFSNQTIQVKSEKPGRFDTYKSICDLMTDYDRTWLYNVEVDMPTGLTPAKKAPAVMNLVPPVPPVNISVLNPMTKNDDSTTAEDSKTDDSSNGFMNTIMGLLDGQSTIPASPSFIRNNKVGPLSDSSMNDSGVQSVAATPVRKDRKGGPDTVGRLINGFLGLFSPSKKSDKEKKN